MMGWSYGTNSEGREVGYSVEATCDAEGCDTEIDRGLAFCCGGMHDGGEHGCGRYFCSDHIVYTGTTSTPGRSPREQLCGLCAERWEAEDARAEGEEVIRLLLTALERSAPADPGYGEIQWRKDVVERARVWLLDYGQEP